MFFTGEILGYKSQITQKKPLSREPQVTASKRNEVSLFQSLPEDLIHKSIQFLPSKDIGNLAQLNKSFQETVRESRRLEKNLQLKQNHKILLVLSCHIGTVEWPSKLEKLDLSQNWNELNDTHLFYITENFPNLKSLKLKGTNIKQAGLSSLSKLKKLTSLSLSELTFFSNSNFDTKEDERKYELIEAEEWTPEFQKTHQWTSMNQTGFYYIKDAALKNLASLVQLTSLDISGCNQITREGLVYLNPLVNLSSLKIPKHLLLN